MSDENKKDDPARPLTEEELGERLNQFSADYDPTADKSANKKPQTPEIIGPPRLLPERRSDSDPIVIEAERTSIRGRLSSLVKPVKSLLDSGVAKIKGKRAERSEEQQKKENEEKSRQQRIKRSLGEKCSKLKLFHPGWEELVENALVFLFHFLNNHKLYSQIKKEKK